MTGNPGGDDEFAFGLIESLYTPTQKVPATDKVQANSPIIWLGLLNLIRLLDYRGSEELETQVMEAIEGKTYKESLPFSLKPKREEKFGKRTTPYTGKVIILMDGGCASSCETVVEKLGPHPNVTLVGQNSQGTLHFSNGMTFILPNSKILVSIPTLFHKLENDAPEGIGYRPDVYADSVQLGHLLRAE